MVDSIFIPFMVISKMFCLMLLFTDKAERLIADAAAYGSQLVVFPEAFIGGYPRGSTFGFGITIGCKTQSVKGKEEFRKYHAAAIDVPGITPFSCCRCSILACKTTMHVRFKMLFLFKCATWNLFVTCPQVSC